MPSYRLAHIREHGQDMLLFPVADRFGQMSSTDQNALLRELEMRAHAAGLAGSAAVFWRHGRHEHFMGPQPWHPFLRSVGMDFVESNINQELSW